jgi:hypothetical protein
MPATRCNVRCPWPSLIVGKGIGRQPTHASDGSAKVKHFVFCIPDRSRVTRVVQLEDRASLVIEVQRQAIALLKDLGDLAALRNGDRPLGRTFDAHRGSVGKPEGQRAALVFKMGNRTSLEGMGEFVVGAHGGVWLTTGPVRGQIAFCSRVGFAHVFTLFSPTVVARAG